MTHLTFVLTAYGFAAGVLLALISWILANQFMLQRELKRLEAQGIRRRSARRQSPDHANINVSTSGDEAR